MVKKLIDSVVFRFIKKRKKEVTAPTIKPDFEVWSFNLLILIPHEIPMRQLSQQQKIYRWLLASPIFDSIW